MSAFIVDKNHIDALVTLAVFGPSESSARYWDRSEFSEYGSFPSTFQCADEIGQMLVDENVTSIHYRYPDTIDNPDSTPGPIEQYWFEPYVWPVTRTALTAVQGLKAINGYEYQACEHPDWRDSRAHAFCKDLIYSLIRHLPGYDEAEWEVSA